MARIAFFEIEQWEKEYLKKKLRGNELVFIESPLSAQTAEQAAGAEIASVFIYSKVGAGELSNLPKLGMVCTRSTGFDHIDLAECNSRNITVCNVPSYGSETVAEHAMLLVLALAKKLLPSIEKTKRGDFHLDGLRTFDLEGKILGIIGLGKIGSHMAKMARAFGMNVIAYSPHSDPELAKKSRCRLVGLDELFAKANVISLHAPLNDQTRYIIDSSAIEKMKQGVIIINTARGGLVDSRALISGLDSGKVAAAGLDVLEEECGIKEERQLLSQDFAGECDLRTVLANHILLNKQNVIITPHNAFNSQEALQRILDTTVENIKAYLDGKPSNEVGKK